MSGETAPTPEELGAKRPLIGAAGWTAIAIGLALTLVIVWRLGVFAPGPKAADLERERKLQEFQTAEKRKLESSGAAKRIDDAMERIANDPEIRPQSQSQAQPKPAPN